MLTADVTGSRVASTYYVLSFHTSVLRIKQDSRFSFICSFEINTPFVGKQNFLLLATELTFNKSSCKF